MSDTPPDAVSPASPAPHLSPHAVPASHALSWYEDALRLFKRAPGTWIALAILTFATEFLLKSIPVAGAMLSELITPVVACGLVYAAAATDRGAAPSVRFALAALGESAGALTAVIAASVIPSILQALAAWWIADVNVFGSDTPLTELAPATVSGIYAIGILASLPFTFVPFHALLERVSPGAAFAASWSAFARNTLPLLAYSAASLVLLGFCMLTMGLGLMLALPLWAASSYAAWKDVFGVRVVPDRA
jgi:uncharacterized membrane protein